MGNYFVISNSYINFSNNPKDSGTKAIAFAHIGSKTLLKT